MNKAQLFLKGHSPTILTIIGSIGVITTAVLAVQGTPKAMHLIDEARDEKNDDLTKGEIVKVAWTAYIPTAISAIATITCVAGANYLNIKKQQSLTSAYMLLDNAFKEYHKRMTEEYGERPEEIYKEVSRKQFEEMDDIYTETLFFEFNSCRFFEANIHKVLQAECKAILQLDTYGQLSLNDYYSYLGIDQSPYGEMLGWSKYQMETEQYLPGGKLEFRYERTIMSNGIVCYNIITNAEPSMDHYCF